MEAKTFIVSPIQGHPVGAQKGHVFSSVKCTFQDHVFCSYRPCAVKTSLKFWLLSCQVNNVFWHNIYFLIKHNALKTCKQMLMYEGENKLDKIYSLIGNLSMIMINAL